MVDLRCVHTSGSRELVKKKLVKKMASVKNCRYLRIFARSVPVHTQMDINKFYCTFSTFLTIPELYHAYYKILQPSGATGSLILLEFLTVQLQPYTTGSTAVQLY